MGATKAYNKEWYRKNKIKKLKANKEWRQNNKIRVNELARKWSQKNKDKIRAARIKREHNITIEEYNSLLEKQNYVCAICKCQPTRALDIDHNHSTGHNRGLLCNKCNKAIALFMENPAFMLEAINYLQTHNKTTLSGERKVLCLKMLGQLPN